MSENNNINIKQLKTLGFPTEDVINALFITEDRIPFVEIKGKNRLEACPVYSEATKNAVTKAYYSANKSPLCKNELDKILGVLSAEALGNECVEKVWTRVAKVENGIEIDLNDETGQCIHVHPNGWEITHPSVYFSRPPSMQALTLPKQHEDWNIFKKHFKTKNEDDLMLMVGYMIACFKPEGPYPILVLQGEQGTAKSTTTNMIKELVDPAKGATRSIIRQERDLFIAAKNNHLLSFDNISTIKKDLSDSLCRLATGGAFSTRTLYTNDSECLIELCKPLLLNGITDFITRADLASRSIIVELAIISEEERKTLEQVMSEFRADIPLMLGVLLNAVSSSLKNAHSVSFDGLPRMADIVTWCTAAEKGLGWEEKSFLKAMENNQLNATLNNLSTDAVAVAFRALMSAHNGEVWKGSASDLLDELCRYRPDISGATSWPSTASYLSQYISRLAPSLRKVGIHFVGRDRNSSQRQLIIKKLSNFEIMNPIADKSTGQGDYNLFDEE